MVTLLDKGLALLELLVLKLCGGAVPLVVTQVCEEVDLTEDVDVGLVFDDACEREPRASSESTTTREREKACEKREARGGERGGESVYVCMCVCVCVCVCAC